MLIVPSRGSLSVSNDLKNEDSVDLQDTVKITASRFILIIGINIVKKNKMLIILPSFNSFWNSFCLIK